MNSELTNAPSRVTVARRHLATALIVCVATVAHAQVRQEPTRRPSVDAPIRRALVDSISQVLRRNYVWPDTAAKMVDYLGRQLRDGAYDGASDPAQFARALTRDLRFVYRDVHLAITYDSSLVHPGGRADSSAAGPQAQEALQTFARRQNFGFKKADILPGNIGYVSLDRLFDINDESVSTANSVFGVVRNSAALIIDLRNNGGGSPDMVRQICNYLFPVTTHIDDVFERRTGKTTAYWTQPDDRFRPLFSVPVYVLVSRRTFSGAEALAYDLQSQHRGLVIGETTGGGAHLVSPTPIGYGFSANVPYARAINPITKTNWEGIGVRPDVNIGADSSVDAAVLQYFELALRQSRDPGERHSIAWSREMLSARLQPFPLDTLHMRQFVGEYEKRTITLENGALYFTGANGNRSRLIPMSATTVRMESSEDMKLEFISDSTGQVSGMTAIFSDGFTATYAKQR